MQNSPPKLLFSSALVTGGGGFLGKALIKELVSFGIKVISLQRGNYPELINLGVDCIQCDISTLDNSVAQDELIAKIKGVEVVFHTAAKVAMWGDEKDFYKTNVDGTKNLISIAKKANIKNFVYTSSPSVIANGSDLRNIDESIQYPEQFEAFYPKTKAKAEEFVLSENSEQFCTLSLRPHLIFGPGDTSLEALVIKRAKAKRLVKIGDGNNLVDFCYIDDCVAAHLCAANALIENPNSRGRPYFITQGIPTKLWEWIDAALKRNNLPAVSRKVPAKLAINLGHFMEWLATVLPFKFEPPFTAFLASEMSTDHYFDISAARKELKFEPLKKDLLNW